MPEAAENGAFIDVTVVDGECFGDADARVREKARVLAAAAGVQLVRFRFDGSDEDPCFLNAEVCPRLDDPGV